MTCGPVVMPSARTSSWLGSLGPGSGSGWRERRVDAAEFEVSCHLAQQAQQLCPVVFGQLAEQGGGFLACG